jgi:hypothetical protein
MGDAGLGLASVHSRDWISIAEKAQIAAFSALPTLPILTVSALAWATATLDTAAA